MKVSGIIDVLGLFVVGGIIYTLVSHANTSKVVTSLGTAFSGALRASEGR